MAICRPINLWWKTFKNLLISPAKQQVRPTHVELRLQLMGPNGSSCLAALVPPHCNHWLRVETLADSCWSAMLNY